jgi:hypothetical protein
MNNLFINLLQAIYVIAERSSKWGMVNTHSPERAYVMSQFCTVTAQLESKDTVKYYSNIWKDYNV